MAVTPVHASLDILEVELHVMVFCVHTQLSFHNYCLLKLSLTGYRGKNLRVVLTLLWSSQLHVASIILDHRISCYLSERMMVPLLWPNNHQNG